MATETRGEIPKEAREFKTEETIYKETAEKSKELIEPIIKEFLEAQKEDKREITGLKIGEQEYKVWSYPTEEAGNLISLQRETGKTIDEKPVRESLVMRVDGNFSYEDHWGWNYEIKSFAGKRREREEMVGNPELGLKKIEDIKEAFEKGTVEFTRKEK